MELPPADKSRPDQPRPPDQPSQPGPPTSIRERERQPWIERLHKLENPPSVREELKARIGQLEPGHPSSPWEDDGTPKPPAPRLSDLEQPEPPLSDADYQAHRDEVAAALEKAVVTNPTVGSEHLVDGSDRTQTAERYKIHTEIVTKAYGTAQDVPAEHKAIIAGGLGGAGKTTVLTRFADIDLTKYVMINPDDFKKELAERGLTTKLPGLSPMETTGLHHEESSDIARRLGRLAMADGKNIIWDITMSSESSTSRRIAELKAAGYEHIECVFVDIPVETSVARSEARHRRGHDQYLAGQGLGGRYVPPELIRMQADAEYGTANRRTFENLKDQFTDWSVYDNSVDGRPAVLTDRKRQENES
jgi:predicted kinase